MTKLLTLALLFTAVGLCVLHADEQPKPLAKPPQDLSKPPEPGGGFTFVESRHRDVLLQLASKTQADPKALRVRVTPSAQATWVLPVYVVKSVVLPTATDKVPEVRITLRDALYDDDLKPVIEAAMDAHPKYGKAWSEAIPTNNAVAVTLVLNVDGHDVPLATVKRTRKVGQAIIPELVFPLTTEDAAKLLAADRANIGLNIVESYAGRFIETDLEATLSVSSSAATEFKNKLGKTNDGKESMLLVAVGGGVSNKVSVRQLLARHIQMEVLGAKDKPVNPALLESVMAKLFAGVTEENALAKQKDDAVVTFVTSNGLKATAAIGTIKGMKDQWKKDRDDLLKRATSSEDRERRRIAGEAEVSGIGGVFGAKMKFEYDTEDDRKRSDAFEQQVKATDEVMKAIDSELPTACLSADQVQKVASNASSLSQIKLGSFTEGQKLIVSQVSLGGYFSDEGGRATERKRLVAETKRLEGELTGQRQKLSAALEAIQIECARVEKMPSEVKALVGAIPPKLLSSQWGGICTSLIAHFKAIHWPPPGYGWDNALKDLLKHQPNSATDDSAIAQSVKAASEKTDALAVALTNIKAARADAVKASAEMVRLQIDLQKVTDDLAKNLARSWNEAPSR